MGADSQIIEYLKRAEEILLIAEQAKEQRTKEILTEAARDYMKWAEQLRANLPQH